MKIDDINQVLQDLQNKCKKLPKGLKDYQAFEDLSKLLSDFTETCPLLEMMSHKAMQQRHWERIEGVTGHKFDIESENFLLKNVMQAPLLKFKEDIEVCFAYMYFIKLFWTLLLQHEFENFHCERESKFRKLINFTNK